MKNTTRKMQKGLIGLAAVLLTLGSPNLLWAKCSDKKSTEEKIKGGIDTSAAYLKKGVDKTGDALEKIEEKLKEGKKKFGEKIEDLQAYFRKKYKNLTQYHHVTVSNVTLNGNRFATVVHPGENIEIKFKCTLTDEQLKDIKYHSLLIGFKGRENAEAVVDLGRGLFIHKETDVCFNLKAPSDPGFYKLRFRPIEGYVEHNVLSQWHDAKGEEPGSKATIGLIYVKKP